MIKNPYSDAQRAILSLIINLGNDAMDVAYRYLEEHHFTELRYKLMWRAVTWLYEANHEITAITVENSMLVTRDMSGNVAFDLLDPRQGRHRDELLAIVAFSKHENLNHLNSYIDIVLDTFKTERYLDMAHKIISKGRDGRATAGQLQAIVNDYSEYFSERDRKQPLTLGDIASAMIERNNAEHGDQTIVHPDIPMIDNHVWLSPGNQTVIAGDTGHGKTSLALQIAWNVAKQSRIVIDPTTGRTILNDDGTPRIEKRRILFFSLEMSESEMLTKLCCIHHNISFQEFMIEISKEERSRMLKDFKKLAEQIAPNFMIDCNIENIKQLIAKANMVYSNYGTIDLVFVDYLQLLHDLKEGGHREDESYRNISRQLKKLAMRIGTHTVPLSQLNKAQTDKMGVTNHRPGLDRLFGSTAMKQDASHVIFVYREWAVDIKMTNYNNAPISTLYISRIILAKHRFGHNNVEIVAGFIPHMTWFVPLQYMRDRQLLNSTDPTVKFDNILEFAEEKAI